MSERLFTASVLAIIFSLLSLLCSLINVVLIHVMQQWNGFLAILYSMTFCRILYDATFHVSSPLPKVETAKFRTTVSFDGILEGVGPFGLIIMPGKVTIIYLVLTSQGEMLIVPHKHQCCTHAYSQWTKSNEMNDRKYPSLAG
jgi:hypothetical protein